MEMHAFIYLLYRLLQTCLSEAVHGNCRTELRTPSLHPPLRWTMPPMLRQHQPCRLAAHQKMKKTALLPMASTCRMAQLSQTAMASDASMSAAQRQMPMPVLAQDMQSINRQMTASGASCLPPFLLSITCGGSVEGDWPNHQVTSWNSCYSFGQHLNVATAALPIVL